MKICLIINPKSGPKSFEKSITFIANYLIENGHEITKLFTQKSGDASTFATNAVKEKFERIVAVGGDGTINEVINGIVNSKTILGIIPTGTANVFAKEIGIPSLQSLDSHGLKNLADILIKGDLSNIDLGKVTFKNSISRYFVMWCGIGLDASLTTTKKAPSDIFYGRYLNYIKWTFSSLKVLIKFSPTKSKIKYDNQLINEEIYQIIVSNGKFYAKYFTISKISKLDDGLFNVVILRDKIFPKIILKIFKSILKKEIHTDFKNIQTNKISIETISPLAVHVDAETIGNTPVDIEIVPKALKIIVPKKNI